MRSFIFGPMASAALALGIQTANAETLQELAKHTHFHGIAIVHGGTAELLLASHHGLFAVDAAGTATRLSAIQDFMGFSPSPANPLTFFASGHPASGGNAGFLQSIDGGATWGRVSDGLDGPVDFHQMDVSPANPKTVYGNYGGLQISHDGGQTWAASGFAPDKLIAIAASGLSESRLFAAAETGLLQSDDAGATWRVNNFDGKIVSMVKSAPNHMLYAFVLGVGLMQANEDVPTKWQVLSNDFGQAVPLHMAVDATDTKHLVLTTQFNGVLESKDGGSHWAGFAGSN